MLDPTVCMYVHVWCACCVVADARVGDTYLCGAVAGYTETGRVCMCATDGTGSHRQPPHACREETRATPLPPHVCWCVCSQRGTGPGVVLRLQRMTD